MKITKFCDHIFLSSFFVIALLQIAGLLQHRRLFEKSQKFFFKENLRVFVKFPAKPEAIRAFHR